MNLINEILKKINYRKRNELKDSNIKIYDDSDFTNLLHLYQSVFPGYMSKELWNWKNEKNCYGNYITILMYNHEELIASYSVSPKEFFYLGKKLPCVQSMDTMTLKKFWGLGISTNLAKIAYELAKKMGYFLVYGFPNENSRYLFEIKLDWKIFGEMDVYYKKIDLKSNGTSLKQESKHQILEIKRFDDRINDLWEKGKSNFRIIAIRGKNYLNWRFNQHPFIRYKKFLIIDKDIDEVISYFVLKTFIDKEDKTNGHIVDYLIRPKEKSLKIEIFKLIEDYSINVLKEECSNISFWLPDFDLKPIVMNELGYNLKKMKTYFGYTIFENDNQRSFPIKLKDWYITMADNDVF